MLILIVVSTYVSNNMTYQQMLDASLVLKSPEVWSVVGFFFYLPIVCSSKMIMIMIMITCLVAWIVVSQSGVSSYVSIPPSDRSAQKNPA